MDALKAGIEKGNRLDMASATFSLFAFAELSEELTRLDAARFILPANTGGLMLLGSEADRARRNQLMQRWWAKSALEWIDSGVEMRFSAEGVAQGAILIRGGPDDRSQTTISGSVALDTFGLGLAPSSALRLVQAAESAEEADVVSRWFDDRWTELSDETGQKRAVVESIVRIARLEAPAAIYARVLDLILGREGVLDEESIVKSATGIRETMVWKKLFKFQRDGVIGAIDKLERSAAASSPTASGLGKTSRRWPSSSTTSFATIACSCCAPSGSAITGPSIRPTTAGTSLRPTASTTTS